jgi:hypothetical protein
MSEDMSVIISTLYEAIISILDPYTYTDRQKILRYVVNWNETKRREDMAHVRDVMESTAQSA